MVDDMPANLRLLTQILLPRGYRLWAVTSGARALKSVTLHTPALILLDIMMPRMDGYETCRRLKQMPEISAVPVMFISALGAVEDKVKAFMVGGVDYINKPFQAEEVLARVATHLTLHDLRRQLQTTNTVLQEQNQELHTRNTELQQALDTIKTLSGLVPICAWCGRKIQDEIGKWVKVEHYIEDRSEAEFTHGICPACLDKLHH